MRFAVLGTGTVGQTVGSGLVRIGNQVCMGSRTRDNEKALEWVARTGGAASQGTFAEAAAYGEVVVNATAGSGSVAALEAAGAANLEGKILIDLANPLVFEPGKPPSIDTGESSLGERIQAAFPGALVVKTLNTVTAEVMVNPSLVPGVHTMFVSGNDAGAKRRVTDLLAGLGWSREGVIDLGDISCARGQEMYLALWLRLVSALGTPHFNVEVRRGA